MSPTRRTLEESWAYFTGEPGVWAPPRDAEGDLGSLKLALARQPEQAVHPVSKLLLILNVVLLPMLLGAGLLVDWVGLR